MRFDPFEQHLQATREMGVSWNKSKAGMMNLGQQRVGADGHQVTTKRKSGAYYFRSLSTNYGDGNPVDRFPALPTKR